MVLRLFALMAIAGPPAHCQEATNVQSAEARAFDIPAQSLTIALKAYGATTGLQLFYESGLVAGRTSAPLHGVFSAHAALQILLAGTGLTAISFDPGTETLLAAPKQATESVDLQRLRSRVVAYQAYFALIQIGLRAALCRTPETQVGKSEIRVQLWVAPSGVVQRAELLSSTGSPRSDYIYIAALQALSIGPPPAAMPQPVTLLILPRLSRDAADCPSPRRASIHD